MLINPDIWIKNVLAIDEQLLSDNGIEAMLLDLDNTLSLHGSPYEELGVPEWLDRMRGLGIKMAIVSNNTEKRVKPLAEKLNLPCITMSCKPLTFGITRGLRLLGTDKKRTALVGDQIITDIIGGKLSRITTILVEPLEMERNPLLRFKRNMERFLFRRDFERHERNKI